MNKIKVQQLCYFYVGWLLAYDYKLNIKNPTFITSYHGVVNPPCENKYKDFGFNDIKKINTNNKFNKNEIDLLNSVYETYGNYCYEELEVIVSKTIPFYKVEHFYGLNFPIDLEDIKNYFKKLKKINETKK